MSRILIVDDEPDICQLIERYAHLDGYEAIGVDDGTKAVQLCRKENFDLIIIDIMMPDMDGYTACRMIRESRDIPVLMLSAKGDEYDKLRGFDEGIDDYLTKPFSPRELMARIHVIISRRQSSEKQQKKDEVLKFQGLVVNLAGHDVYVDGVKTELTPKEFALLAYLARNKGIALSRETILDAIWGYNFFEADRTVDWQIKLLRSKLGPYRSLIHTIRGTGYKFDE